MNLKIFGAALLSGAFLVSSALAQPTPAPAPPAPVPAPAAAPAPVPADTVDSKLDKAFGDHAAFKTFLTDLQKAVADEDHKAVSAMTKVPFKTKVHGTEMTFDTDKDVAKAYDDIVTPGVVLAIKNATYEKLTVTPAGVALGSGEVWFTKEGAGADAAIKIIAINAP